MPATTSSRKSSSLASSSSAGALPAADAAFLASNSAASPASQRAFWLVHANIVAYAFFYWLGQPVLPYLSKELGADNVTFGYFQSFTQLVQMLGAPMIGRIIDVRGAKFALLLSHFVAMISYGLLSQASTIPMLFASQIPTVAMAAMHSSQAMLTLLSTPEERAKQIGRLSLSYGVGFVLGPIIGGTLSQSIGYSNVSLIGCIGSAVVCASLWFFLPDMSVAPKAATVESKADATKEKSWFAAAELLALPSIRTIIGVKLLLGTALAVYRTSFSLVAKDHFGLTAQQNGFILSGVGGLTMVVNIFVIGELTKRFSERTIVTRCVGLAGACFLLSAFAAVNLEALLTYLVPMTVAGAVAATILTSVLTKSATLDNAGSVLGLDMGIGTLARVLAPTIGGWLLVRGYEAVGAFCAALAIGAFVVAGATDWAAAATVAPVKTDAIELNEARGGDVAEQSRRLIDEGANGQLHAKKEL